MGHIKVLGIIPARSGSKSFVNKNLAKVQGKTLIEWAVFVGKKSKHITDVYISTDSKEYEDIAKKAGALSKGMRPSNLASDSATTQDVIVDLLPKIEVKYDYIVLLQPTSPMRKALDVDQMIEKLETNKGLNAIVSLERLEEPHPHKLKVINSKGLISSFIPGTTSEIPKQQLPAVYKLNGSIYIVKYDKFLEKKTLFPKNTLSHFMDKNVNIDLEEDLIFLDVYLNHHGIDLEKFIKSEI